MSGQYLTISTHYRDAYGEEVELDREPVLRKAESALAAARLEADAEFSRWGAGEVWEPGDRLTVRVYAPGQFHTDTLRPYAFAFVEDLYFWAPERSIDERHSKAD